MIGDFYTKKEKIPEWCKNIEVAFASQKSDDFCKWRGDKVGWIGGKSEDRIEVSLPLSPQKVTVGDETLEGKGKHEQVKALTELYEQFSVFFCDLSLTDVVGLAWKNKGFRQELDASRNNSEPWCYYKSEQALTRWFGRTNNWNIRIVIKDTPDAKGERVIWVPGKPDEPGCWKNLPKPRFVLAFPHPPTNSGGIDKDALLVALAAYDENDPGYPFTCPG